MTDWRDFDVRFGAYGFIVNEHHEALLALWNEGPGPQWSVPGGGVEFDESPEEALVREVWEETGYQVEPAGLLGIHSFVVHPTDRLDGASRPLKGVRVIYRADIVGGELTNEVGGSTDEARWIPIVEVPSTPHVDLVDIALDLWQSTRTLGSQ